MPDIDNDWVRNDLDRFIFAKLDDNQLVPAKTADRATLLRRVSLDLIGTYPSKKVADAYLSGKNEEMAYRALIDSLLASPRFGERWASVWLDIARYADTRGYEKDVRRNVWPYRDWLIRAFNADMPYNQFITNQIAGDLLPNPTDAQYIATTFNRNTPTNDEGGTDNEEFRTAAVLDRVNTVWEGLMSTTFACVQCHSHPYDPFKHEEFYKFLAYFNNTRDEDTAGDYPLLKSYGDSLRLKVTQLTKWVEEVSGKERADQVNLFLRTNEPAINSASADKLNNAVIQDKNRGLLLSNNSSARLKNVNLDKADQLIFRYENSTGGILSLHTGSVNGPVIKSWQLEPTQGFENIMVDFSPQNGVKDVYLTYQNRAIKDPKQFLVKFDWFYFTRQLPGKGSSDYAKYSDMFVELMNADVTGTPVLVENPKSMFRKNNVFERGAWTSKGKEVSAGVPKSLAFAMPKNAPDNRLGLSMWLTDKRNPLVSRTMVNRLWEQLYGVGLVETLEDMGTQGIAPTHEGLLDHMAYQFMHKYNWSVKRILKEMVMMATYRQDSKVPEDLKEKDLFNKFYARGSRVRLSAEQIRDQCLAISGVLSAKMYGPPVMPWQPEGIWSSPYNSERWIKSVGEDSYRRSIYTFWKRGAPYPSAIAFDGAQRAVCSPRRIRTNTPLQALVALNDSVYVDLARKFAARMEKLGGSTSQSKIAMGYRLMLYKAIPNDRLKIFNNLYAKALDEFKKRPRDVVAIMGNNQTKYTAEKAAMVVVANAMLNLDEVITKN